MDKYRTFSSAEKVGYMLQQTHDSNIFASETEQSEREIIFVNVKTFTLRNPREITSIDQ